MLDHRCFFVSYRENGAVVRLRRVLQISSEPSCLICSSMINVSILLSSSMNSVYCLIACSEGDSAHQFYYGES